MSANGVHLNKANNEIRPIRFPILSPRVVDTSRSVVSTSDEQAVLVKRAVAAAPAYRFVSGEGCVRRKILQSAVALHNSTLHSTC